MLKLKSNNGKLQQATAAFVGKKSHKYTSRRNMADMFFAACLGAFSLGTVLAWTSPALPHIADCLQDCDYFYTAIEGSWIGSLATLGCLAGCFATGFLMGTFGRKWTITGMAVPLILGWILMLLPQLVGIDPSVTIWIFYVGRFVLGKYQ